MKISMNWLHEYVDVNENYPLLVDKFNLMSQEVESLYKLVEADHLVIGKVLTCEKHPSADKLSLTTVDIGTEVLQIICGAPNVDKDQHVIVALVGATLPGDFKIKKAKIRGIESKGMICSLAELGVKEFDIKEEGIYVLGDDAVIGEDPLKYLSLDDYVLDLDLTANRPDLLSIEGVAYDVACMLDTSIKLKKHKYETTNSDNNLRVFTDTSKCMAYYGQVIENITIKESPYWLKARLLSSGIRPINNVVDISNYVMIEYGQPMHAFDFDKFGSGQILIRRAKKGETIQTLDDQERKLISTDIVITDGNKAVALAGVMGGASTQIDDSTTRILLESACFDPVSVRKTSKRLDLKSEASSRFEKGVDANKIQKALDYATELFIELANGQVKGQYSFFDTTRKKARDVELSLQKLHDVTGYDFSDSEVENILDRLQFKYRLRNEVFTVSVPTRRENVSGYQDLIEEIVRIFGYDKIPTTIPVTPTAGYLTHKQKLRRSVRDFFVNNGFNETKTYSLVSDLQAEEFDIKKLSKVQIMNPLNKEKGTLRHSIIPSLLDVLIYNKSRKMNDVFLFELGKSYTEDKETELLSGVMHGTYQTSLWQGKKEIIDFYLLKGIIESLLKKLKIDDVRILASKNSIASMHPGIYADIYVNDVYLGFLGKLHPQKEYSLGVNKTFVFELNFEILALHNKLNFVFEEIPKYPAVTRDLAIVIDKSIEISRLMEEVKTAGKKTLVNLELFDLYLGENIEENKKSVALTLTLQNSEKTLEAKEVDVVINRILKHLKETLDADLR